jgi:hypothetical protein
MMRSNVCGGGDGSSFDADQHDSSRMCFLLLSKISSAIVSLFTSSYVHLWPSYFPSSPLTSSNLPFFDSRVVCYPTDESVKDYLRWRQVDCHINNLYNTCFWKLVHRYQQENPAWTEKEARDRAHAEMNVSTRREGAGGRREGERAVGRSCLKHLLTSLRLVFSSAVYSVEVRLVVGEERSAA